MGNPDIHVPDFGIFESAAANAEDVAAQTHEHAAALRSALTSSASGIEGTKTAAALHHLASQLPSEVSQWADSLQEISQAARDTGTNYSNTDSNAAGQMKGLGR